MDWNKKSSKHKIFDCKSQELKLCLSFALKKQCVTHTEFVPEGKTKKSEFYAQVLETLLM